MKGNGPISVNPGGPPGGGHVRPARGEAVADGRRALGRLGEDRVAAWYAAHGYEVVARNWSCRAGEIDIIARRGRLQVFCEVKTRSSTVFGVPAEAVGALKQARLRRLAATWYAAQNPARSRGDKPAGDGADGGEPAAGRRGGPVRFDVASVLGGTLEVIEGAF
jgi:putative endonuclease